MTKFHGLSLPQQEWELEDAITAGLLDELGAFSDVEAYFDEDGDIVVYEKGALDDAAPIAEFYVSIDVTRK